jgi:hypothetical protein
VENRFQSLPFKCNLQRYTVELVTATALLRSSNYGIPPQSLFDAKGVAGNIVHAVVGAVHAECS